MPIPVFLVGHAPAVYYPLALGLLQARARACPGLRFMPFLDMPDEATVKMGRAFGPGIWLLSSYDWSFARALAVSRAVKAMDPRNVTIHGGPSIPRHPEACARLMAAEPHMDILVRGEGELTCEEVLRHVAERFGGDWREGLEAVAGLTFSGGVRTPDRPRIEHLDDLPSPYLAGLFDSLRPLSGVLETNRGCPYTCAFCDWGALVGQKIKLFDLERVKAEIEWLARRGTENLFLADANFGIFERDVEIAEHLARMKREHGFPRKLVPTFAKNSTERLVEIVGILRGSGLVVEANVAIQTTDAATLEVVKRKNIRTDRYRDLMNRFRALDIPFNTDLMVNLPGQTPESFRRDLQYFMDLDVSVMIWPTLALPNSALSDPDFRREHRLEVDERGMVVACSSFTRQEREEMMRLRSTWLMAENMSYLRYVMRFLQWDHGVRGVDFLDDLQRALRGTPEDFPDFAAHFVFPMEQIAVADVRESQAFRAASWTRLEEFYEAVGRFVSLRYGVPRDSALATALQANRAVLPDPGRTYPVEVALPHDFAAWYRDGGTRRLGSYGPGVLRVTDPEGRTGSPLDSAVKNTIRQQTWELPSDLRTSAAVLA